MKGTSGSLAPRIADSLKPACVWDKFRLHQGKQRDTQFLRIGEKPVKEPKTYTNPVKEAMALQVQLDSGGFESRAELAKKMGVSRAKITQMLNLLDLDAEIVEFMLSLSETDERLAVLTERRLRMLVQMPEGEQRTNFWEVLYSRSER